MAQITIVVPSYNHEKYIINCLATIKDIQLDKKVYIIDDGSKDSTAALTQNFISDNKLEDSFVLIEKPNGGLNSSLQIAITLLDSKYCYFTASDDMVEPDGFVKLFNVLQSNDDIDFIIGGADNFKEDGTRSFVYNKAHETFFKLSNDKLHKEIFFDYPHPILIQSTIFKSELLHRVNGWDKEVRLDDYALWIKILLDLIKLDKHITYCPEIKIADYRHHDSNSYKNTLRQFELVSEALYFYCPEIYINSSIGNTLAHYFLMSVKAKNIIAIGKLLAKVEFKFSHYFIYHLFRIPLKRIFN